MMSRAGFGAALAAVALMLGACSYTYSINPLSAPGDSEPDARLGGVWQVTSDDPAYTHIGHVYVVPTDDVLMDVDLVGYQYKKDVADSSPVEWARYRIFRTEIDGGQYLNVMPVAGEVPTNQIGQAYFIFKYDISDDGIWTIWRPSDEALRTLRRDIEEGRLAGMKRDDDLIVTDEAANLRDYIRWGHDPFTEHFLTLRKILPKVPGQ